MPIFTQVIPDPEVTQIDAFIDARFPGEPRALSTSWNNKVLSLEMNISQALFDQLIVDLTAAFPDAMTPDNKFDIPIMLTDAAAQIWVAMPAALTEFRGLTIHRTAANLGSRTQAQLIANVQIAGVAGAGLRVQASLDNGANWRALEAGAGTGPGVSLTSTGIIKGPAAEIDALVRKDVLLRVVGGGGNGVISPSFGSIVLRVR